MGFDVSKVKAEKQFVNAANNEERAKVPGEVVTLTLRLEASVVEQAKVLAADYDRSLNGQISAWIKEGIKRAASAG